MAIDASPESEPRDSHAWRFAAVVFLGVVFSIASALFLHNLYRSGVTFHLLGVRVRSTGWERPALVLLASWLAGAVLIRRLRPGRDGLVVLACLTAYLGTLHPPYSSDVTPSSYTALSIATGRGTSLDPYRELVERGIPYFMHDSALGLRSGYPLGPALLAWPVFLPAPLSTLSRARIIDRFGSLAAILIGIASVWLALKVTERLDPPFSPRLLALAYGLGTTHWSTSSAALWQHGPGELWILGALDRLTATTEPSAQRVGGGAPTQSKESVPRRLIALGACLALAVGTRPSLALAAVPILALTIYAHGRRTIYAVVAALLMALPFCFYYLDVYGSPLGPYVYQIHGLRLRPFGEWLTTLFWIFASPSRGILWYEPVVVVTLAAATFRLVSRPRLLSAAGVFGFALTVALYSHWVLWWGGVSFGPRLMTDALPWWLLAVATLGPARPWLRNATVLLAGYGALVNVVEARSFAVFWDREPPIEWFPERLTSVGDSQLVTGALAAIGGSLTRQAVEADKRGEGEVALELWSEEWRKRPWHRFAAFRVADLLLGADRIEECSAHAVAMKERWPDSEYVRHLSQRLPAINEILSDPDWLRPVSARASPNPGNAKHVLDGYLKTRWRTEWEQHAGDFLEVGVPRSTTVRALALLCAPDFGGGPETLRVVGVRPSGEETLLLDRLWEMTAERKGWLVVRFQPDELRSIRMSIADSRAKGWSVSEVRLLRHAPDRKPLFPS